MIFSGDLKTPKEDSTNLARILLMDDDPVFAALLEDRLRLEGHEVTVSEPSRSNLDAARDRGLDGVILDLDLSATGGLEMVQALRSEAATRTTPILVLSEPLESADRLTVYRAGADELLIKPTDPEEALLLLHRLLGRRDREQDRPVLQGSLADHPLWELLQYIGTSGKTGELVVGGRSSTGQVSIHGGEAIRAQWKALEGREALLAMLGLDQGTFRFQTLDQVAADGSEPLPTRQLLMESAWLEDELRRRKVYLPGTGAPLVAAAAYVASSDETGDGVPLAEVHRQVVESPELRIYDLLSKVMVAPKKVRLAVARLVEEGTIKPVTEGLGDYPSTSEIETGAILNVTVDDLLESARRAGLDPTALPCLLLAESGAWGDLRAALDRLPGSRRSEVLKRLSEQLDLRGGGSAVLKGTDGKLSLHVQSLTPESRRRLEVIVPLCAGVLIWLDDGASLDLPRLAVELLSRGPDRAVGILIAPTEQARNKAEWLVRGRKRWQTVPLPPQSLLGILRLLEVSKGSA